MKTEVAEPIGRDCKRLGNASKNGHQGASAAPNVGDGSFSGIPNNSIVRLPGSNAVAGLTHQNAPEKGSPCGTT
jgi:hypothetical protein